MSTATTTGVLECASCRRTVVDPRFGLCPTCDGELYVPGRCLEKRAQTGRAGKVGPKVYCLREAGHDGPHRAAEEWSS